MYSKNKIDKENRNVDENELFANSTATRQRLKNVHLLTDILISLLPAFSLFTEDVTKQL